MQHWTDPPTVPSKAIGVALGIVLMLAVLAVALVALFADQAGASAIRCGGPCPTVPSTTTPTTIATTTIPTTIATTTTVCSDCVPTQQTAPTTIATTTTGNVGICCLQANTTLAPTTTVAVTTTTVKPVTLPAIPGTSAADQTLPGNPPVVVTTVAPVPAAAASSSTLPVTGSDLAWRLVPIGLALLILGGVALAVRRS